MALSDFALRYATTLGGGGAGWWWAVACARGGRGGRRGPERVARLSGGISPCGCAVPGVRVRGGASGGPSRSGREGAAAPAAACPGREWGGGGGRGAPG